MERYLNGKIFPSHEVVAAISDACGGDTQAVLALWERARSARGADRPDSTITPRQLPPDIRSFTGRLGELAFLDRLLADHTEGTGAGVLAIAGTAGVGKSALAAHWARRVANRFPDGQLWVNLRGYDPQQPMTPEQALTGLLRALGVPAAGIPVELEAQVGCTGRSSPTGGC